MLRSLFPSANSTSAVEDNLVTLQVGKRVFPNVSPSLRRELWLSVLQRSRAASRAAAAYPSLLSSAFPQRSAAAASAAASAAAVSAAAAEEEEEEEGAGEGGGETKEGTVPLEVVEAIRRDVGRTFPAVAGFEPEDPCVPSSPSDSSFSSSSKQRLPMLGRRARSLANILTAYAAFDPTVSYCQGMNFLGGLLLIYLDEGDNESKGGKKRKGRKKNKKRSEDDKGEEDSDGFDETLAGDDSAERAAFGLLTHLLVSKGLRALYAEGMEALTARLSHLHLLLPPGTRHLLDGELGLPVTLFAAPWFMTAFASDFPVSIAARLVDAMLTTPPAVDRPLLRLAAACVRACCKELLAAKDAEAAVKVLRKDLPSRKLSKLHDLVSQAFEREWNEEELAILSSEHPRLTTDEPKETNPSSTSSASASSVSSSAARPAVPPLPFEEAAAVEDKSSPRCPPPPLNGGGQIQQHQHRKLKWEDALLARRAISADSEAASTTTTTGESEGDLLQLHLPPLPPPSSSVCTPRAPETLPPSPLPPPGSALASAAEEALAELLSCTLELDSFCEPPPATAAAAAARKAPAPPLRSDSLWTSFRRAAEEPETEKAGASTAAAAVAAARERAAADLEGWSSFQRSASLAAPTPTREEEGEDEQQQQLQ